jgi:hypothetical protein
MLRQDPLGFFNVGFTNLANAMDFVDSGTFAKTYMSDWLPPLPDLNGLHRVVNTGMRATFVVLFLVGIGAAASAVRGLFDAKKRATSAMILAAVISVAGTIFFQTNRNAYNAALVLPLVALVPVVCWSIGVARLPAWLVRVGRPLLFATCVLSHVVLVATFWPRLPGWLGGGYAPEQAVSVSAYRFGDWRAKAKAAAAACGIEPSTAHHLVLDDVTLMALWSTYRPFHWIFIDHHVKDVRALLVAYRSDGVITTCDRFPRTLRAEAREVGELCCMPKVPPRAAEAANSKP